MAASEEELRRELLERELELAESRTRGSTQRFVRGTNAGIAQMLGAPVDLINSAMNFVLPKSMEVDRPFLGSEQLQGTMQRFGMAPRPGTTEGRAGAMGEVTGASLVALIPVIGAGMRGATAVATGQRAQQSYGIGQRIAQDIAQTAIEAPKATLTGEVAASMVAGLGGYEAVSRFPDTPGARAMGEILGGLTPATAAMMARRAPGATAAAIGAIASGPIAAGISAAVGRSIRSMTARGARSRAHGRLSRAVDPETAIERLIASDEFLLPDAPLTIAQRIGDDNLLALERSILEQTAELESSRAMQHADVNESIIRAMAGEVQDVPVGQVKEYLQGLIDRRLIQATQKVDQSLEALGPQATREDLNRLAADELQKALRDVRAQEAELYRAIPSGTTAPTLSAQNKYNELRLSLPRAQRRDMPRVADQFFNPGTEKAPNKSYIGDETEISELRGLQSRLREDARLARSAGRYNRARIADEIAESITDDIGNSAGGLEVREAVDTAIAFSRDLNDRFTRGEVGRLLGRRRTGERAAPDALVLETTLAKRGPRAAEASDALEAAVSMRRPDGTAISDPEPMRQHIRQFLTDDFRRAAVDQGQVSGRAARSYMRDNEAILRRFPEARRVMQEAIEAGTDALGAAAFADPRQSRAAVFAQAPIGQEIDRVIATAKPKEAMQELIGLVNQDPTGAAMKGLKGAFMQRLLRRAEVNQADVMDRSFVSGARIARDLDDPRTVEAMSALFTPDELKRIEQIRATAQRLDRARGVAEAREGVISDMPGVVMSMLGRVLAAQVGRAVASRTGGGTVQTPGIFVAQAQRLLRAGVQDPARRLLTDAISDEELFRALLTGGETPTEAARARRRLNAWTMEVLREQYELDQEE